MAGAIAAAAGYGADAVRVRLDSGSYTTTDNSGGPATCLLTVAATGGVTVAASSYTWKLLGNAADYDIHATVTGGTLTSGTTGSWLNLATSRQWSVTRNSIGSKTCTLQLQIRDAVTLAVLATATVTLTANVNEFEI